MGTMYPVVAKAAKLITFNQCHGVLGNNILQNIGRVFYPSIQAAPAFPGSFPMMFGSRKDIRCLIPQAIDQDPFFRLCRDIAPRMGESKPACIHCKFFPAMEGPNSKMSSSSTAPSTIFMTDTPKMIHKKVNRYAFSGGQDTKELQQKYGANLNVDVAYQYLRHIMEDDERLQQIGDDYAIGKLMTGEVKKICSEELTKLVERHQMNMSSITDETVRRFMDPSRESLKFFASGA
jgi:tryptophanyl-tRNA synthetase